MLERCSRSFRLFLKALENQRCPFCAVGARFEQESIERLARERAAGEPLALCGRHLRLALKIAAELGSRKRTNLVRSVLSSDLGKSGSLRPPSCKICERVEAVIKTLVSAVRGLDDRMRFEKALDRAPLFCRFHAACVCVGNGASNFARIQSNKLNELSDELVQAFVRNRDTLEQLIESATTYVEGMQIDSKGGNSLEPYIGEGLVAAAERAEFERWDNEQVLKHLSDLETEVAKLRYLVDENRRLRLAHAAVEAARSDLERERQALRL